MTELNNLISTNFYNDIYITGIDFQNLHVSNKSTDNIYSLLIFQENIINTDISVNGKLINSYNSQQLSDPVNEVIFSKPSEKDTENSFDYIIENKNLLTNINLKGYLIISNSIYTKEISFGETSSFNESEQKITINQNLYDYSNIKKNELFYETINNDDNNTFIIPLNFHIHSLKTNQVNNILDNKFKYDKSQSKYLIRTNPKLSGNIKVIVNNEGNIYFDTFNVDDNTNNIKYKKQPISEDGFYPYDIKKVFGDLPKASMYKVKEHINNSPTINPIEQYNMFYSSGAESNASNLYKEKNKYFAPLYLSKDIPNYFIIFAIDNYNQNDFDTNSIEDFIYNARIAKTISLKNDSKIGKYIRKYITDISYKNYGLETYYKKFEISKWFGIDYNVGILTNKGEYLYDYIINKNPSQSNLETHITDGFERNGLIYPSIINLEFLFDDPDAKINSLVSYFGFYVDENILQEVNIDYEKLGLKTNNIYQTNNVYLNTNKFNLIDDNITVKNAKNKIFALKGKNNKFLKIKNIINNKVTIQNDKFNISDYYNYDTSIKQFKAIAVKHDTQSFANIDFSNIKIDNLSPFEMFIYIDDVTYNFYGTTNIAEGKTYSYFSYDALSNTKYGVFSLNGDQDTIITTLAKLINQTNVFETIKKNERKFILKTIDYGDKYNNTKIEFFFNNNMNYNSPNIITYLHSGSYQGTQFLVSIDDISYIHENYYFKTLGGYSQLEGYNNKFYFDYIYDLKNDKYKILTIKNYNDKIKIDSQNYVYASKPINPLLNLFSIYSIADFDYELNLVSNNNIIYNELKYLNSEREIDLLINKDITLKHNIYYKLLFDININIDSQTIYAKEIINNENYEFIVEKINEENQIFLLIKTEILTDYIKLNINGLNIKYYDVYALEDYNDNKKIPFDKNDTEYLFTYLNNNLDNVNNIKFITTNIQNLTQINSDTLYDNIINSLNYDKNIINIDRTIPEYFIYENNTDLILNFKTNLLEFEERHISTDFTKFSLNNILVFKNLSLEKNNKLINTIEKRENLIFNKPLNIYNDITNSVILPTMNKWSYLNTTDINNKEYLLNNSNEFDKIGGSPDISMINPSIANNTFQWALCNNVFNNNYIDNNFTNEQLLNKETDYFSNLFYSFSADSLNNLENLYSYIYKSGNVYYTIFKGVKYKFTTINEINNYKFAIIYKQKTLYNKITDYDIIINDTFKNITLVIYVSYNDTLINGYGMLYTWLYSLNDKFSNSYYLNSNQEYMYGSFNFPSKIIQYDDENFFKLNYENETVTYNIKLEQEDALKYILPFDKINPNIYSTFAYFIKNTNTNYVYGSLIEQIKPSYIEFLNILSTQYETNFLPKFKIYNLIKNNANNYQLLPSNTGNSLVLSLLDFRTYYGIMLNSGKNLYSNINKEFSLRNATFNNNKILIEIENTKEINTLQRYDGIFAPKLKNIFEFNKNTDNIIINDNEINLQFSNCQISDNTNYKLSEFYFNKLTEKNLNQYINYYNHPILKSCLDNNYYKYYVDNSDTYNDLKYEKLNKNFFNSLIFNTNKEIDITPFNSEISYNNNNDNNNIITTITFNLFNIINRYFKSKLNFNIKDLNLNNFIKYNIYNILVLNNIQIYSVNDTINSNITINQNINIINEDNNVKFIIVNNIVSLKLITAKKDIKQYKIKLNLKHK